MKACAVTTVSSRPTAVPVVRLRESVMCWSTAVERTLNAHAMFPYRTVRAVTITSLTVSLAPVRPMMNNAAITGEHVSIHVH